MKYTIIDSKVSIDQSTGQQYKDQYGNLSWNVMANDEQGQTYSFLKRTKEGSPIPKIGDVLEGEMKSEMSKKGTPYWKFVSDKKWEDRKSGGSYSDPNTMILSYAKDIVVALISNQAEKTKLTTDNIKDDLETLSLFMKGLLDQLKGEKTETPQTVAPKPTVQPPVQPPTPVQPSSDEISSEDINQIFPEE